MYKSKILVCKNVRVVKKQRGLDELSPEMDYLFFGKIRPAVIFFTGSICQICVHTKDAN